MLISNLDTSLLRLLQLSSVSLPVGGYSFSQGLEYAVDSHWVTNCQQVAKWTELQLNQSIACLELPILRLTMQALLNGDNSAVHHYNDLILACRESKELKLTDTAMGAALARVMQKQNIEHSFQANTEVSFVTLFAITAHHWSINYYSAALGFSWSWLENQISAATKLIPLGQSQAQQLLSDLQPKIVEAIQASENIKECEIGSCLPALAIASALHETQYSRLFRS